jgi:TatD DNase family protein
VPHPPPPPPPSPGPTPPPPSRPPGRYHGKVAHPCDLTAVLDRAGAAGVSRIIVTAGNLEESRAALALARRVNAERGHTAPATAAGAGVGAGGGGSAHGHGTGEEAGGAPLHRLGDAGVTGRWPRLYTTVGVHPTRTSELSAAGVDADAYIAALRAVADDGVADGTVVAVGECGLDYDRLHFSDRDTQVGGTASPPRVPLTASALRAAQ